METKPTRGVQEAESSWQGLKGWVMIFDQIFFKLIHFVFFQVQISLDGENWKLKILHTPFSSTIQLIRTKTEIHRFKKLVENSSQLQLNLPPLKHIIEEVDCNGKYRREMLVNRSIKFPIGL